MVGLFYCFGGLNLGPDLGWRVMAAAAPTRGYEKGLREGLPPRKLGQRPETTEDGAREAVEAGGATVGFRRAMADAEVVVGNKDIWTDLLLSALRGRRGRRRRRLRASFSFLIASFVEFRVHPTGMVSTIPGESLSSVGAGGGGDGRVASFLKAPPWSC